jgi:formate-dependent nitrite reductase membrane component NrfD
MLVSLLAPVVVGSGGMLTQIAGPLISLLFLTITAVVLIADLERPERFFYILVRPNWRSWMVWGAYFLTAQGAITALWIAAAWLGSSRTLAWLFWPAVVSSILTTCYTGFLFAQGLARDLWQGPHATIDLLAQAIVEGAAVLLLVAVIPGATSNAALAPALALTLVIAMIVHLILIVFENLLAPSPTRHHELATRTIRRGSLARLFWSGAIAAALASVVVGAVSIRLPPALALAAILALAASFTWEYIWVEAGQSVPLS